MKKIIDIKCYCGKPFEFKNLKWTKTMNTQEFHTVYKCNCGLSSKDKQGTHEIVKRFLSIKNDTKEMREFTENILCQEWIEMSKKEQFIEETSDGLFIFYCPGCKCSHGINNSWKIDLENNTISPSVLVKSGNEKGPTVCHSFVKNGHIQYLNDCTHDLKGKTVPMEMI